MQDSKFIEAKILSVYQTFHVISKLIITRNWKKKKTLNIKTLNKIINSSFKLIQMHYHNLGNYVVG